MRLRDCLNPKVLVVLVAVAAGVVVFAPHLLAAALPVLLLLACPLSMLAMVWVLRRPAADGASRPEDARVGSGPPPPAGR